LDTDPLARTCAEHLVDAFARYNVEFRQLTRRTASAFADRDLARIQALATQRIELYNRYIDTTVETLRERLGERAEEVELWARIKAEYQSAIRDLVDRELNKTFFNSLTRRFFGTVGVNRLIEFVNIHDSPIDTVRSPPLRASSGVRTNSTQRGARSLRNS